MRQEESVLNSLKRRAILNATILDTGLEAMNTFNEREAVLELVLVIGKELRQIAGTAEAHAQRVNTCDDRWKPVRTRTLRKVQPVTQVADLGLVDRSRVEGVQKGKPCQNRHDGRCKRRTYRRVTAADRVEIV